MQRKKSIVEIMGKYRKRVADKLLKEQLESAGVVLIQGAKWCGKTTTAENMAASVLYMDNLLEIAVENK